MPRKMHISSILNNGLWWLGWLHWNDLMGISDSKEISLPVDGVPGLENSIFKITSTKLEESVTFLVIKESTGTDWAFIKTLH